MRDGKEYLMKEYQMSIPCLLGVEGFVGDELRAMEARDVQPQNASYPT